MCGGLSCGGLVAAWPGPPLPENFKVTESELVKPHSVVGRVPAPTASQIGGNTTLGVELPLATLRTA